MNSLNPNAFAINPNVSKIPNETRIRLPINHDSDQNNLQSSSLNRNSFNNNQLALDHELINPHPANNNHTTNVQIHIQKPVLTFYDNSESIKSLLEKLEGIRYNIF